MLGTRIGRLHLVWHHNANMRWQNIGPWPMHGERRGEVFRWRVRIGPLELRWWAYGQI